LADYLSVLTGGSNNFATTSEHLNALQTDILSQGVTGTIGNTSGVAPATGSLACNAQGSPDMTVAVTAGKCYVTATPTSQGSQLFRANIAAQNATIAANSTGGTRYDWIYVTVSAANAANPNVAGDNAVSITVSRSTSSATDNGTPPTYGYCIAVVTVINGASSITNGSITDRRSAVSISNNSSTDGWTAAEATPNTVTANGNRSYDLAFNSIDLTDTMSPGMRLKMTRTSTAPTQCTSLNGTTQYYSKATPNKLTFTDDFVVSAWIKLTSYPATGTLGTIISRSNGTSGWFFAINEFGQIVLNGHNAAIGNYSRITSYSSVPLNKWVHVAAQLDMSTFTATTTTSYIMIDGLDVPGVVSRAGTNPTALIQAGNLNIGSYNSGAASSFFPGSIAQVAVYNAKVTQATILASMHQTLTGSETSLASAYSFNNAITDLNTTTPNDLTANGSAVATNADSPFSQKVDGTISGSIDYGVITKASFSTNTTLTVQVPEGNTIPTSGGVGALSYSSQAIPYGFISARGKWRVEAVVLNQLSAAATGAWQNIGSFQLYIPIGSWMGGYDGLFQANVGTTAADMFTTLSTANNTESDKILSRAGTAGTTAAAITVSVQGQLNRQITTSSATRYYLNQKVVSGTLYVRGDDCACLIYVDCSYI
jgi:hypothetical protein